MSDALYVIHPDASAVMGDGRVLVALHNAEGDVTAVESEKPELAAVVMAFARPAPLHEVTARFPYFPADTLLSAVELLRISGVLIEASDLVTDESVEREMMTESARALAKSAANIEQGLTSLGPGADAVGMRRRLRSVEAQAKLVAREISRSSLPLRSWRP